MQCTNIFPGTAEVEYCQRLVFNRFHELNFEFKLHTIIVPNSVRLNNWKKNLVVLCGMGEVLHLIETYKICVHSVNQ